MSRMKIVPILLIVGIASLTGCKKYDTPEYVEIDTNETAFVIPLEGDTGKQVQFESAEALEKAKVAAKRIQIPHRWNKTGRLYMNGEWIDTIRVIKVSRTPVTREWVADEAKGTNRKDDGLWAESADSVGFSTGFTCTAYVPEDSTAKFLYSYNGESLATVMDTEVRAQVQSRLADFAARYDMDELRSKKGDMIAYIRDGDGVYTNSDEDNVNKSTDVAGVVEFFSQRGIEITTIGQFGGFTYENPEIQQAIDAVFVVQQEKEVAKAQLDAQKDKNTRLRMEGEGIADKARETAKGNADAVKTEAAGQAEAIRMVAEATKQAGQDPLFLEVKKLEVEERRIERWNGDVPATIMSGGENMSFLLPVPKN